MFPCVPAWARHTRRYTRPREGQPPPPRSTSPQGKVAPRRPFNRASANARSAWGLHLRLEAELRRGRLCTSVEAWPGFNVRPAWGLPIHRGGLWTAAGVGPGQASGCRERGPATGGGQQRRPVDRSGVAHFRETAPRRRLRPLALARITALLVLLEKPPRWPTCQ